LHRFGCKIVPPFGAPSRIAGNLAVSKQQTANRKQQTGNSKQETANRKQQTGNSKQPGSRQQAADNKTADSDCPQASRVNGSARVFAY
jgi:hypothetical protein